MDLDEPEDDEDEFSFDGDGDPERREGSSRSSSDSPATSIQGGSGDGSRRGKSSEIDTEDDPIGPITPHAGTFSERGVDLDMAKGKAKEIEFGDNDDLGDDEDWVDPVSPESPPVPLKHPPLAAQSSIIPISKKPRGQTKDKDSGVSKKKKRSKHGKEVPIIDASQASQHFPFPSSTNDELSDGDEHGGTSKPVPGKRVPQMRTTKARDGGRTQSGGVKGILVAEDGDDF
jgi:cysteine protease ATG4